MRTDGMKRFKNNLGKKDAVLFIAGILASAFFLAVDLIVKQIIIEKVLYGSEIVVIKNFFSITHIRNTGAAWGIFSSKTEILTIVTIICSVLIFYLIYASTVNKTVMFCFSAILGGACGNLTERLRPGYVADFLAFRFFGYDFPNFNVADMCITVGCIVLAFYIIFLHRKGTPLFREGTAAHRIFKE